MGPQQAADTMEIVMRETANRKGELLDETRIAGLKAKITSTFESQMSALYTSGLLLDDGLIDPRDTRRVLALTLKLCVEATTKSSYPMQFGVARP